MKACFLAFAICALAGDVWAHARGTSYSSWDVQGQDVRVVFRVAQLELTRLPWGAMPVSGISPGLSAYLREGLRLHSEQGPCRVMDSPRALRTPADKAAAAWTLRCPSADGWILESRVFLDVAPSHLHFARVREGDQVWERVLVSGSPRWELRRSAAGSSPAPGSLASYLGLGVEHIATGYDHLAFLAVLLLAASRFRELVTIVTGFTIAHSVTLALAVLGVLRPQSLAIEAVIGLSIAIVALENAWLADGRPRRPIVFGIGLLFLMAAGAGFGWGGLSPLTLGGLCLFTACYFSLLGRVTRPTQLRIWVALTFGLVHGFGFAGVLAEMELPRERTAIALLGFNLGVEAGQLVIVAMLWPVLRFVMRSDPGMLAVSGLRVINAGLCGLGVFWFLSRAYG